MVDVLIRSIDPALANIREACFQVWCAGYLYFSNWASVDLLTVWLLLPWGFFPFLISFMGPSIWGWRLMNSR